MTNVTPRRSKRLQDGDSEEPEVAWDFGSASPRSRLNLCRQYDRIYHASNEQLREQLATFFPETAGESTDESSPATTYEPRVQPVARDSPATDRRKRAHERQRRKDKALLELEAVVKEISQNDARVSASPVLDATPKSRRAERRVSPIAGVDGAATAGDDATASYIIPGTVPCQLFGGVFECDDVLKDITENVDDIFTLSANDMDLAVGVGSEAAAIAAPPSSGASGGLVASGAEGRPSTAPVRASRLSASGRSASCRQRRNGTPPFSAARPGKAVTASSSAPSAAAAVMPSASHCTSYSQRQAVRQGGSASVQAQPSAYTRQQALVPGTQSRSADNAHPLHKSRSTGSACDLTMTKSRPQAQAPSAATVHQKLPAQRQPAANISNQQQLQQQQQQQQRRCTQEEIDRKRRLAKQKLLKQKYSAQHAASQACGGRAT